MTAANRFALFVTSVASVASVASVHVLSLVCGSTMASAELIHHWEFDEAEGTELRDRVSASGTGTLRNFPPTDSGWVPGVFGSALEFDGIDQYVEHGAALPRQQGTLTQWLMPFDDEMRIAYYESDSPDAAADYNGYGSTSDLLENHSAADADGFKFFYQDGSGVGVGRFAVGGGQLIAGRWTHVAVTWDRAGDLVLYVDCVEVDRVALAGGTFSDHEVNEAFFGRPSEATRFWRGRMDDVRIYDHVLESSEIRQLCRLQNEDSSIELGESPELAGNFGTDVALAGDLLAVSDFYPDEDTPGNVYVYRRTASGEWLPEDTIEGPTAVTTFADHFGVSLATDGVRIAVSQTLDGIRSVQVYSQDEGTWSAQSLLPPDGAANDFGHDLALDEDWLAVGTLDSEGAVYLYRRDATSGAFELMQTIADEAGSTDRFGVALALDLPYLVVGSVGGRVAVYELGGSSFGPLLDHFGPPEAGSASSVAVSGTHIAIGRPSFEVQGVRLYGAVELLELLPGGGVSDQLLVPVDGTRSGSFGARVALNGRHLVVGSSQIFSREQVYLFYRSSEWQQVARLRSTPWQTGPDYFGGAVAAGAEEVMVSATGHRAAGAAGIVYVYRTPIFLDGFESGDLAGWSQSAP